MAVRTTPDRIILLLIISSFITRLIAFFALSKYDSNFYSSSLSEAYLFPRLSVNPWQVDWSYGPLTYLLYWEMVQTPFASILARICNFLADSISVFLIVTIGARFISRRRALITSSLWAFATPVVWASLFVSTDSIPVTATLGALYLALTGKLKWSVLLVGIGFALKWYPILILPLIIRNSLSRRNPVKLTIFSLAPFLFSGLIMIIASIFSGVNFVSALALTFHNFASRFPAGTSIWNLLLAVIPANAVSTPILIFASFGAILGGLLLIGLRSTVESEFQLFLSAGIMLFSAVNLASQIQGNYLLWYYPLMLVVIMRESDWRMLIIKLSLLGAGFLFNFLFILPRLATIGEGPVALRASSTPYDTATIILFQGSAWILVTLLLRKSAFFHR